MPQFTIAIEGGPLIQLVLYMTMDLYSVQVHGPIGPVANIAPMLTTCVRRNILDGAPPYTTHAVKEQFNEQAIVRHSLNFIRK